MIMLMSQLRGGDSGAKYWDIRGLDLKDCEPYYKRAVSVT